jgi:hypothetical protein
MPKMLFEYGLTMSNVHRPDDRARLVDLADDGGEGPW